MDQFKVGDRINLLGSKWKKYAPERGKYATVQSVDSEGYLTLVGDDSAGGAWDVNEKGWEVELNTDTPREHFAKTAAKFASDPLSTRDIESLKTLGEALGISSFESNVRRHTDRIADLLIEKNKQYSNSALDPIRVFSKADRTEQLRVRADDKLSRIRNGDTSEDALTDLAGYIILMKIAEESA